LSDEAVLGGGGGPSKTRLQQLKIGKFLGEMVDEKWVREGWKGYLRVWG